MRYADGPGVSCDLHVEAPPARLWEVVCDIRVPARFSPELQRVAWLDGAHGPAPGARFEGHNHRPGTGTWRTVSHIVEVARERALAWAVTDPDGHFGEPASDPARPLSSWRYELTPEGGGTRLRHSVSIGPARSGITRFVERAPDAEERIIASRLSELRAGMEATLRGVKALAEGGG